MTSADGVEVASHVLLVMRGVVVEVETLSPDSIFRPSFQLLIRTFPSSFLDSLHQLIKLSYLLITHLVHRTLVQHLPLPIITLKFLTILLPFGQEANNMKWIVDILVSPEFSFEVGVPKDAVFGTQLCSMGPQKSTVEWDWWKESQWL